jgi:hypothetical protein
MGEGEAVVAEVDGRAPRRSVGEVTSMLLRSMAKPLTNVLAKEVVEVNGGVPCRCVGEGDVDVTTVDGGAPR